MTGLQLILACVVLCVGSGASISSTIWNDSQMSAATDGDDSTCMVSGLETVPWFVFTLNQTQVISTVNIKGSFHGRLRAMVGDDLDLNGNVRQRLRQDTKLCGTILDDNESLLTKTYKINCIWDRQGRYLALQGENTTPRKIKVCELTV